MTVEQQQQQSAAEAELDALEGVRPAGQQPSEQSQEQQQPVHQPPVEMSVKPMSEYNPDEPENNVRYISDEEYAKLQQPAQETPAEEKPVVEEKPASEVTVDYNAWLTEKTGGKVKSVEDLEAAIAAPQQPQEIQFANDESKMVFELLQQGKTEDVLQHFELVRFLDGVPQMSDVDAISAMLQFKDSEATAEDIRYDLNIIVGVKPNKDSYDDDMQQQYQSDLRQWERKARMEAIKAREYLAGLKKDIKLPEINRHAQPQQPQGYSQADLDKMGSEFSDEVRAAVESNIGSFKSVTVPIIDKEQGLNFVHEFTVSEQDKAVLTGDFKDYLDSFESRYNQGGKYDGQKLIRDRFIADNFEKIVASAAKRAYSQGQLSVINNTANSNLRPEQVRVDATKDDYITKGNAFIDA
jgi:hypothetical protein